MTFTIPRNTPDGSKIQLRVALMPSLDAKFLPDYLVNRYQEGIAHGAKASLMQLPDMTFSKPELSMLEQAKFEQSINAASVDTFMGLTKTIPRLKPSWC